MVVFRTRRVPHARPPMADGDASDGSPSRSPNRNQRQPRDITPVGNPPQNSDPEDTDHANPAGWPLGDTLLNSN